MQKAKEKALVLIVDLDNTLCNGHRRLLEAGAEPARDDKEAFSAWLSRVQNETSLFADEPVTGVMALIQTLSNAGVPVNYLTSREERWRDVSQRWLKKHKAPPGPLLMRPNGDWRSTGELKGDVLREQLLDKYEVEAVMIDDDPVGDLAPVLRALGVTHLKLTNCLLEE